MCFYDMHVSQDSYFWSAKKITNSTKSDVESFVELVGGVSSQDVAFASPDLAVRHAERRSKEYAAAVGELVANRETSMLPLYRTSIVQKASLEGAQIQTSALLGDEGESPLFDGGLVPTTDGMGWQHTK